MQYYIKSVVTLKQKISGPEDKILKSFFEYFDDDPLLAIQKSFLSCHFMYKVKNNLECSEVHLAKNHSQIKSIIKTLIKSLSEDRFISRFKEQAELFKNEYIRSRELPFIKDDFINSVFSECQNYLSNVCIDEEPDDSERAQYTIYKQIFIRIVVSFNESYINDSDACNYFFTLYQLDMSESTRIPPIHNNSLIISQFSEYAKKYKNVSFSILLKWFTLIYELKFIFGDINSTFDNLNLTR
ncbi:hypothetical protein RF11_10233 [Thelohanellus kitauei]|uniref:Uncharacterized protein n=1 Tax=Thelohanellus kitauei TaxID=669202 RepID=A0A0C2MX92_THEKT|nr:hypothetical protein RF11_10233 [Thelohanellus kitauei]